MSLVLFNEDNKFDDALALNQDVKNVINSIIAKKEEEQVLLLKYLVRAFKLFKQTNGNPSEDTRIVFQDDIKNGQIVRSVIVHLDEKLGKFSDSCINHS